MDLLFLPIQKIDEEQRLVYLRAAQETPDRTRPIPELMDYAGSKPHFERWSAEQHEASLGKSFGNVREMHMKIAAGHVHEPLVFNDADKAIDMVVKVSDDQTWAKCLDGTLTGASIGGSYEANSKRTEIIGDKQVTRYNAVPSEVSLVDRPMIPTATFRLVKADGSEEQKHFAKVAEREDTNPAEGKGKYGDVKFADDKNKKYPIDTEKHVRAALSYWGMPKNRAKYSAADQKTIGARIRAAARKFGIGADKEEKVEKTKCYTDAMDVLNKWAGEEISDVYSAAQILMECVYLLTKESEEGHPEAAAQVAALSEAIKNLKAFIVSEIQEADEESVITLAEAAADLQKAEEMLRKSGRVISSANLKKVQAVHDHAVGLGAKCQLCAKCQKALDAGGDEEKCEKCGGALADGKCAKCTKEAADDAGELQKVQGELTLVKTQLAEEKESRQAAIDMVKTDDAEKLAKAVADHAEALQKIGADHKEALAKIEAEKTEALAKIEALNAMQGELQGLLLKAVGMEGKEFDLEKIKGMAAPAKGVKNTLGLTKSQDSGGTISTEEESMIERVAAKVEKGDRAGASIDMIKLLHTRGGMPLVKTVTPAE